MNVSALRTLLLLAVWLAPAVAAAQDDPYAKAIDRIDNLYL